MTTAYITHSDCLLHHMFVGHPECPDRLVAIEDRLKARQVWDFLEHIEAEDAVEQQLLLAHSQQHLDSLAACAPAAGEPPHQIDPDTFMNEHTLKAALKSAGAGTMAVDLIMQQKIDNAFCAVRPPGHHAERDKAMGFCFFNNIAVAAAYALDQYALERVAIIDFDVHHGNGTENIFLHDSRVMICSSYEHPMYPYSGCASIAGHIINSRLDSGSTGADFRQAVEQQWLPELAAFKPQFIFISAGFDAHQEDEMAQLKLNDDDYLWVSQQIKTIADKYAEGRIVSMLEGGYALNGLATSSEQHIRVLMGID